MLSEQGLSQKKAQIMLWDIFTSITKYNPGRQKSSEILKYIRRLTYTTRKSENVCILKDFLQNSERSNNQTPMETQLANMHASIENLGLYLAMRFGGLASRHTIPKNLLAAFDDIINKPRELSRYLEKEV